MCARFLSFLFVSMLVRYINNLTRSILRNGIGNKPKIQMMNERTNERMMGKVTHKTHTKWMYIVQPNAINVWVSVIGSDKLWKERDRVSESEKEREWKKSKTKLAQTIHKIYINAHYTLPNFHSDNLTTAVQHIKTSKWIRSNAWCITWWFDRFLFV